MKKTILSFGTLALSLLTIDSCSRKDCCMLHDAVFKLVSPTVLEMSGVVNSNSLNNFNLIYKANPNINVINIYECDGSMDDEVNLKLSKRVHNLGLNTHLMDNGIVASGGTDFFLAGIKRTAGVNAKFGVHSWAGDGVSATDFPVGHTYHQPYIDYYKSIGFSDADAKAFYYFTINAASADDIHWMTNEEITKYDIITN